MPKINVKEPFDFSEDGNTVARIECGVQEVSERCAIVGVDHLKKAELAEKAKRVPRNKARKSAPEKK